MVQLGDEIKTPSAVIEKYCHSTGALNRFHSVIMNMLDGAWPPSVQTNTKSDYDFLVTLTDNIKVESHFRISGFITLFSLHRIATTSLPSAKLATTLPICTIVLQLSSVQKKLANAK